MRALASGSLRGPCTPARERVRRAVAPRAPLPLRAAASASARLHLAANGAERSPLQPVSRRRRPACPPCVAEAARSPSAAPLSTVALAAQAACVAAGGAALVALLVSPLSPYAALPEAVAVRGFAVAAFWAVVDAGFNAGARLAVLAANAVLLVLAFVLPVLQTLPEALLLAVTELGGLVLDLGLVAGAAAKAVALKGVYLLVLLLDAFAGAAATALLDTWLLLKAAAAYIWARDPVGLLVTLAMARPFAAPAAAALQATKLAAQTTMTLLETVCALAYATPAALGVALIPAAYAAHAVWRRARRVVVLEPPLSFTVAELEAKVAQLTPLRVPALPVAEKAAEVELLGFVNALATLPPLAVPPFAPLNAQLAEENAASGADNLARAAAVNAEVVRDAQAEQRYSVRSATTVTMAQPRDSYDGLAAARGAVTAFEAAVAGLPPLADSQRAVAAAEQAAAAAEALAVAEAALAEAEAAFYALDSTIAVTTTTTSSLSSAELPRPAPPPPPPPPVATPASEGGLLSSLMRSISGTQQIKRD